jgi:glycogen debranching enzyme
MLWMEPAVARGVLCFLATHQATETRPDQDAEPGKILHEARDGEMAALREIPFGLYYGSVDSTPLFVMLAAAYHARTGDRALVEALWPQVERALAWIDRYGDADGDGFVEYVRRSADGLQNQGWKDSHDSVFHADGSLASGPIALSEVQAYAYAARLGAAHLASVLGLAERAAALLARAEDLRRTFEERFWAEDLGTYALALDGDKRPCLVRTSNAGHALFAGIADRERALRTAETLLGETSFSGWGVRTVDACERRYNPMSYHNGSIWPHDNALIAAGLARYGRKDGVLRILEGLFDAAGYMELNRMPELFCGFKRRTDQGPTLYPVACAPQSWAAGAVLMVLQAALGLMIDAPGRQVVFQHPVLPAFLKTVTLEGIRVGEASVDVVVERHAHDVGVTVARREGDVEIVTIK